MRRRNPNMSGRDGGETMVVDEGEEREIERGEEEGPGPTPDRKGDDVDESLEGEHGEEPEEGFHVEGEKKPEEGRRRKPWSLVFHRERRQGHYNCKDPL
jgi:hypothetical protein